MNAVMSQNLCFSKFCDFKKQRCKKNIFKANMRRLHQVRADFDQQVATNCLNMAAQFRHLVAIYGSCRCRTTKFRMLSV